MAEEEKKEELEKIIDSGIASLTVDGRTITYRNQQDLERALERLKKKSTSIPFSIGCNPYYDKNV